MRTLTTTAGRRTGTVGAYVGSGDVELVRRARQLAGAVTVSGKSGRKVLRALAQDDDLWGVDIDPAEYLGADEPPALFPLDWEQLQRDFGLATIRSRGTYARDDDSLRHAFGTPVGEGVVRVICVHESWLSPRRLGTLLAGIRNCDDPLAFVLAAVFDPLSGAGAVDGLRAVLDAAAGGRRIELLRTDTNAIPFAAHGGTLGTIGLTSNARHRALRLSRQAENSYIERQCSQQAWVPHLMSWQYGVKLGSLTPFGGAGITECGCAPCDGRSLLRFDRQWPKVVPLEVRADAQAHDLASWCQLAQQVLGAGAPEVAWREACNSAVNTQAALVDTYRVSALTVPKSISNWT